MANLPTQLQITRQFTNGQTGDTITLRSIEELPGKFRSVFAAHPYFNILQSIVLDRVIGSDSGIVVSAPTGCGKTGVFELAIVRMLMSAAGNGLHLCKAVYLAPIKALCDERHTDWSQRFGQIGYKCCKLTGDTDSDEFNEMKEADIVVATPEKWDSMTRRWKDNEFLVKTVRVFMVDEVHLVGDSSRGATLETVVSRMKTISQKMFIATGAYIRFVAVSATLQNIEDFGDWLSSGSCKAVQFKLGESLRPVQIQKIVLTYPCQSTVTDFKFDMSLNYKLADVIGRYSGGKPTLVFCSTRKSTVTAAGVLKKQARLTLPGDVRLKLQKIANLMKNPQLADLVRDGIGFHHAGLDRFDRSAVEELFIQGDLPVLLSTSTLAMGVNLPAHLVIIKSTSTYAGGTLREYSETDVMQMIGRAGRPQFDTTAVAIIMTKSSLKSRFEQLTSGTQVTESALHKQLMEHVNAEISLKTFSNGDSMLAWLKSTFLYLRIFKNPQYYNVSTTISVGNALTWLQDLCSSCLRELKAADLIDGNGMKFQSTMKGSLMAKYYIAFDTMKMFGTFTGMESLSELLTKLCEAKEFADVQLRVNEKMALNTLNHHKNSTVIRFPMKGKIISGPMKVNCLIQAVLGSLAITDQSLAADANKIMRTATRVAKCLGVFIRTSKLGFLVNISAIQLTKCLEARMWEESEYVARQIRGIGPTMGMALVHAGYTSFPHLERANPREIEVIINRRPPFGNQLLDAVERLPKYTVTIDQSPGLTAHTAEITVTISIKNCIDLLQSPTAGPNHAVFLMIGDAENSSLLSERLIDSDLVRTQGMWSKKITIKRAAAGESLQINLLSETMIGLDVACVFTPFYIGGTKTPVVASNFETSAKTKQNSKFRQTELQFPTKKRKANPGKQSMHIIDTDITASHPSVGSLHLSREQRASQSPPTETSCPYPFPLTETLTAGQVLPQRFSGTALTAVQSPSIIPQNTTPTFHQDQNKTDSNKTLTGRDQRSTEAVMEDFQDESDDAFFPVEGV